MIIQYNENDHHNKSNKHPPLYTIIFFSCDKNFEDLLP